MNLKRKKENIIFVISAGAKYGLGHLMRCSVLAREAQRKGASITFMLRGDEAAIRILHDQVHDIDIYAWGQPDVSADVVVFDTRETIDQEVIKFKNAGAKIVLVDRLLPEANVDLFVLPVISASVPKSIENRVLAGADYVVLAESFLKEKSQAIGVNQGSYLLVSMGGSDPLNITEKVLEACSRLRESLPKQMIKVVLGPTNKSAEQLNKRAKDLKIDCILAPDQETYRDLLLQSALVVLGFGISVYETSYLGIPSLYITHYREDLIQAKKLATLGLGRLVGYGVELSVNDIKESCLAALNDPAFMKGGFEVKIDGLGSKRIVDNLLGLISSAV
ncbi:hypothetical protein A2291_00040 [candidate division WOR-1 bacterium RIFOXYB2_FULL_42_35]|uniref:Glycosyl transferase family 28 C-terminal domain-containing protein n=1 Tax=candidate division WOR-1 bacterium RIFOXYC2_FULL_41_25 TaxID=1802586 RepID=A0A1F4TM56_UNCSA|nr:MAG: hypothetical protein A2247_05560 [candidate division WOR-1 bacterium RIFOXYA2_FULL_41_14]OGC24111.1 MAG: hypothetical protein A2291_00040 [candidate division WOR-1 bacterium RIFOXYB2_FULL_42_35]OGC33798.1 MAG: hypothetical protein A2462_01715 [candidate division WOR-1 bacterium RIFOXYC2_FULL_41_25]OGC43694.1 MAG: hypothetical protein A2548_05265 [candidate division WOR-1 bacterium RIFOXYD2_FULL_41_8]